MRLDKLEGFPDMNMRPKPEPTSDYAVLLMLEQITRRFAALRVEFPQSLPEKLLLDAIEAERQDRRNFDLSRQQNGTGPGFESSGLDRREELVEEMDTLDQVDKELEARKRALI